MPTMIFTVSMVDTDTGEDLTNSQQVTTVGESATAGRMDVLTSETAFSIPGDIGNAGQMYLKNHDDTNYVEVGYSTGVYVHRLEPGEAMLAPVVPTQSAIYMLANGSTVSVQFKVVER